MKDPTTLGNPGVEKARRQIAVCTDCLWTDTAPGCSGRAARHAKHHGHLVEHTRTTTYAGHTELDGQLPLHPDEATTA